MTARSDASTVSLLLTQRLVERSVAPLRAKEYWRLVESLDDPAALLGRASAEIASLASTSTETADRVAHLLDAATAVAFELERLEQSGIRVLTPFDDGFPSRLTDRLAASAPPVLYVAGDVGLLSAPSLGIVGSRDVGEAAGRFAQAAAREAVAERHVVVSGGAKGVDQLAMRAAHDAGGATVGVLADSLVRRLREPETRQAVIDGTVCLCTPYKPTAGFTVANAMGRNKIVYALSDAVLVVAAGDESGGTWAGATEALTRGIAPVLVWDSDDAGPGNRALIANGGIAVQTEHDLFPLPSRPVPSTTRTQLSLEL